MNAPDVTSPDPIAEAAAYQRACCRARRRRSGRGPGHDAGRDPRAARRGGCPTSGGTGAGRMVGARLPRPHRRRRAGRWPADTAGRSPTTSRRSSATTRRCGSPGSTNRRRPDALLALFEALRQANWRSGRGLRREHGPGSGCTASAAGELDLMFRMVGGHDRIHLAQARRALGGRPRRRREPAPA